MYYLHHYFDPDFSHMKLAPREGSDGSVDQRYLGYVQNVVAGQVLAELIDLNAFPDMPRDPRFIYTTPHLPIGPNTAPHPENSNKIVAAANGYCFYHDGLLCVKRLLNVRGNVGFNTGNIFFVGDLAVHGDVLTGFALRCSNILVKGHIESAKIKSAGDIVCLSGVKGANPSLIGPVQDGDGDPRPETPLPSSLLDARGNIRLPFCEHVQLRARGNVIIDGHCLHSTLYVGGNLIIKGRLQGGSVHANGIVYVEGQLGSDYSSPTRLLMGYDPFDYLALQKMQTQIRYLEDKVAYFKKQASRNQVMEQEYLPRLEVAERKLHIVRRRRSDLWRKFSVDEQSAPKCRVIVPGKIMPGCEISIARSWIKTQAPSGNSRFMLVDDEVIEVPGTPSVAWGKA